MSDDQELDAPAQEPRIEEDAPERYRAIRLLLRHDPKLHDFMFQGSRFHLAASPRRLKRLGRRYSAGEQILLHAALDLWNDAGDVRLADLVFRLDEVRVGALITAIGSLGLSPHVSALLGDTVGRIVLPHLPPAGGASWSPEQE